jgi:hypothetical protein
MLLDENLLLEFHAVAHLHEFVGVARIAVFASKLASTVGIDGPRKRHPRGGTAIEQRLHQQGEVLNIVSFGERLTRCRQARNSNQARRRRLEQGKGICDCDGGWHGWSKVRFSFA